MIFKKYFFVSFLFFLCLFANAQSPKYVFYFIGDGMGINSVEAALIYQSSNVKDLTPSLVFTDFPVTGFVVTRSASHYITDSSAGGTALATGHKTNNGVVGMDTQNNPVFSVMSKVQERNWFTGIVTSTSLDDATPASFYAHATNRNLFYDISRQISKSGINFFGGPGFKKYTNKPEDPDLLDLYKQNGYNVYKGMDDYSRNKSIRKNVVLIPNREYPDVALPLAIDRHPGDMTLEQLTASAIEYFDQSKAKNFMLMVEAGLIDHAAHPNDAAALVHEVIDFSKSVKLAYDFYLKHPKETLIILTADHETGGLGLGMDRYHLKIQNLKNQKVSLQTLSQLMTDLKKQKPIVPWEDIVQLLKDNLGFWENVLVSDADEQRLKECYSDTFTKEKGEKIVTLYSSDEPLAVMAVDILNKLSNIGWISTSHTAAPVPIYAIGVGAEQFTGRLDNTVIPQKVEKILGIDK